MQKNYILALDQGTTSSRSLLIDHDGNVVSVSQKEFTQIYPQPGWVEHDAIEIWHTQNGTMLYALDKAGITANDISAIGITNQRETTVVWDRKTGLPIYNAIVWQDRRTSEYCQKLINNNESEIIKSKTGLVIDAYFSATKVKWILDNVEGAREKANNGELAFGTIDSWLVWNLTGGKLHITDVSNASRTMIFNIHTLSWDEGLLSLFDIPKSMLPDVVPSSDVFGIATINGIEVPIAGIAGDQQAALFGQMCIHEGEVKNTYGTGCFMLMNTGEKAITSTNNLLTTIAWQINNKTFYALEGSVFIGGAVVQWLRDELKMIEDSNEIERIALMCEDNGGVVFVPAFTGLGAPYWNQDVRGNIFGLTRGSNRSHIARAALESIAFQTYDVLNSMKKDSGLKIPSLKVDGGATKNNLLMQFQSDVLDTKISIPENTETTAMGVAYLAGLAVGYWENIDDIKSKIKYQNELNPAMKIDIRNRLLSQWKNAVEASIYLTKLNNII